MFYMEWTLLGGGGGFNIQCGALSKWGGGTLKKHKDMRGVLKKIPVQRRGSPEKMQNGEISSTPPPPPWA